MAARVHGADAIGVAVRRQPGVAVAVLHDGRQQAEMFGIRLRVDAAEAGIHLVAQIVHVGAGAHEHLADRAPSRAIHGIVDNAQLPGVDNVEINQRAQVLVIGPGRVELDDAL